MMVVPHVLVNGTGVAAPVETQLAAGRHGRFQASGPLVRLGVVSRLAEILRTRQKKQNKNGRVSAALLVSDPSLSSFRGTNRDQC